MFSCCWVKKSSHLDYAQRRFSHRENEMREWATGAGIDETQLRAISDGVIHHGRALPQSLGGQAEPIACAVMEDGKLIGGATGRTEFQRLFVNYLWIDEPWRGTGLGAQALRKLEELAIERGCKDALIETLVDDTAAWYSRCGYELIAHLPRYCGEQTSRYTLLKSFSR